MMQVFVVPGCQCKCAVVFSYVMCGVLSVWCSVLTKVGPMKYRGDSRHAVINKAEYDRY